jgi:acyl-coenzyme A thioesterase PaaI-like protein
VVTTRDDDPPMLIPLHNDDWGYETNCFVCEPTNPNGLQIPFFHDTDREVVTAEFSLDGSFSGAPTLIHGGVTLAVLDEAMAWACIAIGKQWAVTVETTTRFDRAVRVDSTYSVEAAVVGHEGTTMRTSARVLDRRGAVRAEAQATFATLGEAQAIRIAGGALSEADRQYVHD